MAHIYLIKPLKMQFWMLLTSVDDLETAHTWRATTVASLVKGRQSSKFALELYRLIVTNFLGEYSKLVCQPVPDADIEELLETVSQFGRFVLDLWSHKHHVKYLGLRELLRTEYPADESSAEHAKGQREQSGPIEAPSVVVVVQPLIIGSGTPEGKDYDCSRVWSRLKVRIVGESLKLRKSFCPKSSSYPQVI